MCTNFTSIKKGINELKKNQGQRKKKPYCFLISVVILLSLNHPGSHCLIKKLFLLPNYVIPFPTTRASEELLHGVQIVLQDLYGCGSLALTRAFLCLSLKIQDLLTILLDLAIALKIECQENGFKERWKCFSFNKGWERLSNSKD